MTEHQQASPMPNQAGETSSEGVRWDDDDRAVYLSSRSTQREAAFFLAHLKPAMRVLDCGCGTGSITLGLAAAVAPGEVIGIDREEAQLARARAAARASSVPNVDFRQAEIYALPFPDASFDAVIAHAVLQHLSRPEDALKEIHRVLKPGGFVGVREEDRGADLIYPLTSELQQAFDLLMQVWLAGGGDPYLPRRYRPLLRAAGFARTQISATCEVRAEPTSARLYARAIASFFRDAEIIDLAAMKGWADRAKLETMYAAFIEWADHPDAFWCETWCEAVTWKAG